MISRLWTELLVVLALGSGIAWLCLWLHEHGIRPVRSLRRFARGMSIAGVCAVALWAAPLIQYGSGKGGGGSGATGVPPVGSGGTEMTGILPVHNGRDAHCPGERAGLPFFQCGDAPVTNADWLAFGAHMDWFTVPEGGWCFRFGTDLVERVTVLASGEIRAGLRDVSNRISVLSLPLSIVPAANWRLIPQPSLFWHSATPSNSLLLTWENALVNRDTNLPVTVQAELFPSGAAAIQYDFSGIADASILSNAAARIWRDGALSTNAIAGGGQGLPALPETLEVGFGAPQITGTNTLSDVYARIADGSSNAYYFADVAVPKGPVRIAVDGLGESTLGDYGIMVEPGVTNRLPFLIGERYRVSSETAFSHFGLVPSEGQTPESHPSATNLTDSLMEVQWPVAFALDEIAVTAEATVYALRVTPDFLGGMVRWDGDTGDPMRGAPPLRSGGGCACGCQTYGTNTVSHASSCTCGECSVSGDYAYEGHVEHFVLTFPGDGGGGDDPPGPGGDGGDDPPPDPQPSVSVSFETPVVIFEDEYENSPGVFVPRRSTTTKLTVTANGGENGGTLDIQISGGLCEVPGSDPRPTLVSTFEQIEWEAYCEATNASPHLNGAVATATFTDSVTGQEITATPATATAVKIRVTPSREAPENYSSGRHKYGVCEIVNCFQSPSSPSVVWTAIEGEFVDGTSYIDFICPLYSSSNPLRASIGNVTFTPNITVVEPQGIIATNAVNVNYGDHPNKAGYVGMQLALYVTPLDVSFDEIAVEEVPSDQGEHAGHFTNTLFSSRWSHTRGNGAGNWIQVGAAGFPNRFGVDNAAWEGVVPCFRPDGTAIAQPDSTASWSYGYMYWQNPFGWNHKETTGTMTPFGVFATGTIDEFFILPDGTMSIIKLQNTVTRMTNDCVYLNGVLQ